MQAAVLQCVAAEGMLEPLLKTVCAAMTAELRERNREGKDGSSGSSGLSDSNESDDPNDTNGADNTRTARTTERAQTIQPGGGTDNAADMDHTKQTGPQFCEME